MPAEMKRAYAITDRYSDAFFGGCGFRPDPLANDRVFIGYWLAEPHWGQGLAAEAAQAIIDHAFETNDIGSVWAHVRTSNHQSKRVLQKCGFQFVRSGMAQSLSVNGMVAIDHYSISRRTWDSLHAWGER